MGTKVDSKKAVPNAIVRKNVSGTNFKAIKQKMDIKQSVKLLETGELRLADIEGFADELKLKPQLGDHIQFELHKYCKKDVRETNTELVVRLAELCYSHSSVPCFNNIDRFVGCVFYISNHLLKKERFKTALIATSSLVMKKNEILERSKEKPDIRSFLSNLHNTLIASAIALAPKIKDESDEVYEICQNLATESLNLFKLTAVEQPEVGRKVLKTTALYLQTLKHYREEDVSRFYQTLRDVLKILLPQMGSLDYFLFYLSKISQMKKPETEAEVQNCLRKTLDLLSVCLNCSPETKCVLGKILDFFWVDPREEMWITDEDSELLSGDPAHNHFCFLFLSTAFSFGMPVLWSKFEKTWCENVSLTLVEKLSGTVMDLHKSHYLNRQFYCSPGNSPVDICYGDLLTGNLQKIQYTIRLCLKNKLPKALSLVPISQEAFRLSTECLEHMKTMGCCEKQRTYSWKYSVIHHTNTVEDICRIVASQESWNYLKECSEEVLREVVNSDMELPFDFTRIKILFQRWHTGNLKMQNYQQALYACVVYYVFYPKEERDIISMWLQTKSESSNEIFQEITMAEMFKTCDQNLREFCKTYKSSNICLKSALLMELKAYSTCLPDTFQNPNAPYNLATRIWKQLEKWKLEVWESSVATSSLILASLAGENEKLPNGFQEKCGQLIETFRNQGRKEKMQCRSLLHAANLTFSLFLHNVKTSERSEGKMEATQMVLGYLKKAEEEKVKFGEDVDSNLICDVIPSSRHLTVELETNYFNELNRIVDLWNEALKCGSDDLLPTASEFDLWLRNVKQVANMYEMFGEYQRGLNAWLMFYRIGKLCNNPGASLLGLSHLLKDCTDIDASGMKTEAELISGKLGSETAEKHVLVEYSLAVASNYLKNKKSDKCLEYLSRAKKALEGLQITIKSYTLSAKFWCLVSQFLVVYREYEAVFGYPVGTDVRVIAFRAFGYANGGGRSELIKSATQSECTEHVLAMLDVNLWAYHLHGVYRQTDFMRFFLDDLYQIVQRLFLPTRTAEMLARLAEVDMICEKGPDCWEKVLKLKSILTTLSSTCDEVVKIDKPTSPYLKVPQKSELEVPAARPISPVRFINKCPQPKEMDLSPVHFYLKDRKTSKTEEHVKKCKCRLCQNLLIQTLTMTTMCLEAEIHNLKNGRKEATACYGQACDLLTRLENARLEQSETLRSELESALEQDPGELELKLAFIQFHSASFLIKFALFESSIAGSVTENVTKTIQRISKLMKKFSYEEKLLQWTFTELKLFCVVLSKGVKRPPRKSTPAQLKTANVDKTPFVASSIVGRTPVIHKSGKDLQKSPRPCAEGRKISFEEEKNSEDDAMNVAFVENDKSKTGRKVIRPRKLNFQTNEPETNTKTLKKATKDRLTNIPWKKLDFDISGDLFEQETPAPTRAVRQGKKTATATAGSKVAPAPGKTQTKKESVKIYTDAKDDAKKSKKNGETKSRTRKT